MPSEKRARQRAARQAKLAAMERQRKRKRSINLVVVAVVLIAAVIGLLFAFSSGSQKSASSQQKTKSTPTTSSSTTTPSTTTTSSTSTTVPPVPAITQAQANQRAVAAGCPSNPSTELHKESWSSPPPMTIDTSKNYTATIETDVGNIVIALNAKAAPQTVNSFVFLANHHFYDCVIFHRVIPGFMDQTGDPTGTGTGGPGYTIPDELPAKAANPSLQYPLGSVDMANTGQPNSGGSQFFIVAGPEGESLPNSYTMFGQVTSGMDVVDRINADGSAQGVPPDITHRMLKVTISES